MLAQYVFRFSFFNDTNWTRWVGLRDNDSYFQVVKGYAVLLFFILLQRYVLETSTPTTPNKHTHNPLTHSYSLSREIET